MKDRVVEFPRRMKMTDVLTGDAYIFDVESAEGNVSEAGTPYNTANVLSDATAASLGLSSNATPNDAFAAIATVISSGGFSILYEEEKKQESGTTLSLQKTFIVPEDGDYYIASIGYASSNTVLINNVSQTLNYEYPTDYIYVYISKKSLLKDDVIDISLSGSGHVYEYVMIANSSTN